MRYSLTPLINVFFPPACLHCGGRVAEAGALCAECWGKLSFITAPMCARCGVPYEFARSGEGDALPLCPACRRFPPQYSVGRAVLRYDSVSKPLVLRLKHHDDAALAPSLGRWMARAGIGVLNGADAIIPVPLHYKRLVKRRYNQSALLARAISQASGVPIWPEVLGRLRSTPPQAGLPARTRRQNVRGAFAVPPAQASRLRGMTLVLVDDVFTTGATVNSCAETLLHAGAKEVRVLTLTRVMPGQAVRHDR